MGSQTLMVITRPPSNRRVQGPRRSCPSNCSGKFKMADTSILENRLVYIGQEKDDPKLVVEKNHACACQKSEPEVRSSGTGSDWKCRGHVFWDGKPLTSWEKGSRAQIRKERTVRNAYMTSENRLLARVGNR